MRSKRGLSGGFWRRESTGAAGWWHIIVSHLHCPMQLRLACHIMPSLSLTLPLPSAPSHTPPHTDTHTHTHTHTHKCRHTLMQTCRESHTTTQMHDSVVGVSRCRLRDSTSRSGGETTAASHSEDSLD